MTLDLRRYTSARVSLGRAGSGLPTRELLEFQLAQAQARDAVHGVLDVGGLLAELEKRELHPIALNSLAKDRTEYLRNPCLGRSLSPESLEKLQAAEQGCDVALVIADGLSAVAIDHHAMGLLDVLLPLLAKGGWRVGPACVVEQGRVAIGDGIGEALGVQFSVVMIGERPGLSSPDSLGVYLTWEPRAGRSDAERNCISNIRPPDGLGYCEAVQRLYYLLQEGRRRQLTGVALKDLFAGRLTR